MTVSSVAKSIFRLSSAAVFIASALTVFSPAPDAKERHVTLGSRAAVNTLLNGNVPWRWQMRAGGTESPRTLLWPVKGRGIGRGYGSRNGTHLAIDITAPVGTPVRAVARGVVGYADDKVHGYGKLMLVLHPGCGVSLYAHLSGYRVRPGERIKRGQIIALTGSTGISRGPHLHFALFENGKPVNPEPRFQNIPARRPAINIARRE